MPDPSGSFHLKAIKFLFNFEVYLPISIEAKSNSELFYHLKNKIPPLLFMGIYFQGVGGALTVLMKDAIKPNLMQTLEVKAKPKYSVDLISWNSYKFCAKSFSVCSIHLSNLAP